jgi:L-threonylcarbamoyladenylate synthase
MTERIKAASPEAIGEAARLLREGALVAFPTETVYGLGADATQDAAVARIFEAKRRPRFNPLIAHFADLEAAREQVVFDQRAERLAAAFWPGPLTLVLKRRRECRISLLCSAGLDSQAVRLPRHPVARELLRRCARPLAAPSANLSGRISPTTAQHVASQLGPGVALILDGGPCEVGLESTVLDLSGGAPRLLRPGAITLEMLEERLGAIESAAPAAEAGALKSPGMLESHYAPRLPLRLNAESVQEEEALLAFGKPVPVGALRSLNLSEAGDLVEAAAKLFAALHALDAPPARAIAVMPIPEEGLGRAINDRLRRAAAPRP